MVGRDSRAICADCGHTWSWHDRDAARKAVATEFGVDRPCYREISGAPCRCRGFRDSGDVAVSGAIVPRPTPLLRTALLTLLLVALGLGLLYAYRAQAPALPTISMTQAINEINTGQVSKVTITGNKATLDLRSGERQQLTLPDRPEPFQKLLDDHNAADPSRQIVIEYRAESPTLSVIGSIILSLLPMLLVGGLFFYTLRQAQRR